MKKLGVKWKMINKVFLMVLGLVFVFPLVSSAHYIVGYVNDALDGTQANMHEVVLWNPSEGFEDNLTGVIGPSGNSGQDNMYMFDCELLDNSCNVGDLLRIKVYDIGDNYISTYQEIKITGAGYDFVKNISLNSPVGISSVLVDDSSNLTLDEIDLLTNNTRKVFCEAVLEEYDRENISNIYSEFFGETSSFFGDVDDNNHHYSNLSCFINQSYGNENQSFVSCSFDVWYYANSENWKCIINAADNFTNSTKEDSTFVNELLSISVLDSLDFGMVSTENVSSEHEIVVYNKGNVVLDLSLSGYGQEERDGLAFSCQGQGINISNKRYSFESFSGNLNFSEFDSFYSPLTSSPIVKDFNLDFRKNDLVDNTYNSTYWRVYVPAGINGNCQGNIVFGAVKSE